MSGELVTSVRVSSRGGHDVIRVWNRGGLAGELVVALNDGAFIASRLVPEPCTVSWEHGDRIFTPGVSE